MTLTFLASFCSSAKYRAASLLLLGLGGPVAGCGIHVDGTLSLAGYPVDAGARDIALPGPINLVLVPANCTFGQVTSGGNPPFLNLNPSFPVKLTADPGRCPGSSTGSSSVKLECVVPKYQFATFRDLGPQQPYRIDISHKYWLPLFPVSAQIIAAVTSVLIKQRTATADGAQIKYTTPGKLYPSPPMSSEPTVSSTVSLLWKPPAPLVSDDMTLTFEASFVCSAPGTTLQREIEWEVAGITLTPTSVN